MGSLSVAQINLGPTGQIQVKGVLGETKGGTAQSTWTKGDLLCATGTNTLSKLAVGTNTNALVADSTQTCGIKWAAISAGGTVTHTGGALTANQIVIGAGSADVAALGSLGTTTTVLHGNASGAPSFGSVVSADMAVVNTRRVCMLQVGDGTNTVASGDYSPFLAASCYVPYAATIVEIGLQSDAGTPSVLIERRRGASTLADLLSGALAAAGTTHTCAMASTSQTCIDGTTSSGSITLSNTSLTAGDIIEFKSGTASTEKSLRAWVVFTVN